MIKRKPESKKKKTIPNNPKNQKIALGCQPEKFLLKLTGGFLSAKPANSTNSTQFSKVVKSGTATPSNKNIKSKENLYQSVFYSKKTSETMTPFDYEQELN